MGAQQEFCVRVAPARGSRHSRAALSVSDAGVGAPAAQQERDDLRSLAIDGEVQRCVSVFVLQVDVDAVVFQQRADDGAVVAHDGPGQRWSDVFPVAAVGVDVVVVEEEL